MKKRMIKKLKKDQCPVYLKFGNFNNWGIHYNKYGEPRHRSLYLKDMTPAIFYDYDEHELYHEIFTKLFGKNKNRPNIVEEHWIIDKILQAKDDWIA